MDITRPAIYLIRGLPGSGKSTFAKALEFSGVVSIVIEADKLMKDESGNYKFDASKLPQHHLWCQQTAIKLLNKGVSVAVSNTSTTEKEVYVYQKIAEETNANFFSVIVENRHDGVNIHDVPEDKIQKMKYRFSIKL